MLNKQILKSSTLVAAGNILVQLSNLIRDISIASTFGITSSVDAFFLALTLPVFILTVSTGAFRNTITPIYEKAIRKEGEAGARVFLGNAFFKAVLFSFSACLIICVILPFYAPILAKNLQPSGDRLLVTITWFILPMLTISGLSCLVEGPLNVKRIFFVPSVIRVGLPLGIAFGSLLLGSSYGVIGICIGGLVGASLHSLIAISIIVRKKIATWSIKTSNKILFREFRLQFFALSAGVSIVYVSPLVDQMMSAMLGPGAVSTLAYANRLAIGVASLVTTSLGAVLLTHFSKQVVSGDMQALKRTYAEALKLMIWTGIGCAGVVWLLSAPLIRLLFESGRFTREDSIAVAGVLGVYCLWFPPMFMNSIGVRVVSATGLNKIFIPLNIMNAALNATGNYVLMQMYGVRGIALSTATTSVVSLITLTSYLRYKGLISLPADLAYNLIAAICTAGAMAYCLVHFDLKLSVDFTTKQITLSLLMVGIFLAVAFVFLKRKPQLSL